MRTATTLYRTPAGWTLAAGPDVPADKQRAKFHSLGDNWPKDVIEVRFQLGDMPAKTRDKERATSIAEQTRNAEKKAADKLANALKLDAEKRANDEKARADKLKADADANAKAIAAKEASKVAKPAPTRAATATK